MDRREALKLATLFLGGTIVGGSLFLESGCGSQTLESLFSEQEIALLDEIADTILPRTATPGAKDAKVGIFMSVMVRDCYTKADQDIFIEGLTKLQERCMDEYKRTFMECSAEDRTELLIALDAESKAYKEKEQLRIASQKAAKPKSNLYEDNQIVEVRHYFRMMKELAMLGYFTSEIGAKQALRYIETPGRYVGDFPYKKGDRGWA